MRRTLVPAIVLVLSAALAAPAAAGGWATVEPDEAAAAIGADTATEFGFTVLQHGVTPAGWETATLVATNPVTGTTIEAQAKPDGVDGHFVVSLVLPEPGDWTWQVELGQLLTDAKGTLTVLSPEELWNSYGPRVRDLESQLVAALERVATLEQRIAQLEVVAAAAVKSSTAK